MISIPGLNVYCPLWTHIPPRASRNALSCCSSRKKKMQAFCPLLLFPYLCLLENTCTYSAQIVFSFFPILQHLCILFSSRSSVFPRKTASGNVRNVHTAAFSSWCVPDDGSSCSVNLMEHRLWCIVVLQCLWLSRKSSPPSLDVVNRNLLFQNLPGIA